MIMQENTRIFQGMRRDNHPIKQDPSFLWDAHNIRLTARDGNTQLSITNEKSTTKLYSFNENETYIGHSTIGNYLILFTHTELANSKRDTIYRITLSPEPIIKVLYSEEGASTSLNFNVEYPIQAISDYESELVQKVYWVDGNNRPRLINVAKPELTGKDDCYNDAPFDFVQDLKLDEEVTVTRQTSGNGIFPAGTIQYVFTYYNKYQQETNIFHTSELLYLSHNNRGGSPEDSINTAFDIEVKNIDSRFDYLRIYSIIRTSIDAVPTVKRVTDIELLGNNTVTYIDTGTTGDIVDPTSLLYIGGKDIVAGCIHSKDNTLFLGDITYKRKEITDMLRVASDDGKVGDALMDISIGSREIELPGKGIFTGDYVNVNQLSTNTSTFKRGETYRLGLQFQYKTGEWSSPIFCKDVVMPYNDATVSNPYDKTRNELNLPTFYNNDNIGGTIQSYINEGYVKVRPVIVLPTVKDMSVLAQGVLCPTVFSWGSRKGNTPYVQSSWLFRPQAAGNALTFDSPELGYTAEWRHNYMLPTGLDGRVEIQNMNLEDDLPANQGSMYSYLQSHKSDVNNQYDNLFFVDKSILTFHSPDIEFNDPIQLAVNNLYKNSDGNTADINVIGIARAGYNYGDINVQVSSVVANPKASGFVHNTVRGVGRSLISGLYYEDSIVDETKNATEYKANLVPCPWMTYMWHRTGSLNNDVVRPEGKGARTSVLSKKIISNFKDFDTAYIGSSNRFNLGSFNTQVFRSNDVSVLKFKDLVDSSADSTRNYYGNVDTLVPSNSPYKLVFANYVEVKPFNIKAETSFLNSTSGSIGDYHEALKYPKDPIRMKYKSTPHAVVFCSTSIKDIPSLGGFNDDFGLWIADITKPVTMRYGGKTEEAIRNNLWIPAGPAVKLKNGVKIEWMWGDTWYQRYECLKTYPFTMEDENQVIEIGSFMLETRVNMDGRYDRNGGQTSNLYVSPTNFNLINQVYSQKNNFFNYRILDKDYYKVDSYPSQILWTNTKLPSAIQDNWTNLHMASTLDLDGTNGRLISISSFNDILLGLQETAIEQILFNSRVQIQASDGVPIEIANSQKVEGTRTISSSIGCQNKFSVVNTPIGLYFTDNYNKSIYVFNNGLTNVGLQLGSLYWMRENNWSDKWSYVPDRFNCGIRAFYDSKHQDVYFTPSSKDREALCYSEQLSQFTSFISYGGSVLIPHNSKLFSVAQDEQATIVDDEGNTIDNPNYKHLTLWENFSEHQEGYNNIFGKVRPFSFSFISNDNPVVTKIFDTVEFRADSYVNGTLEGGDYSKRGTDNTYPKPINYVRSTNEYQDTGEVQLNDYTLRKKFRVWRLTLPRVNRMERIRNPWTMITLGHNEPKDKLTILHDLSVKYTL